MMICRVCNRPPWFIRAVAPAVRPVMDGERDTYGENHTGREANVNHQVGMPFFLSRSPTRSPKRRTPEPRRPSRVQVAWSPPEGLLYRAEGRGPFRWGPFRGGCRGVRDATASLHAKSRGLEDSSTATPT